MASPQIIEFPVFDATTGALVSGLAASLSFDVYEDETGTPLTQPGFTEIGSSGHYYFTPTFTANHAIAYSINTGANHAPTKWSGFLRPEDFNTDQIPAIGTNVASVLTIVQNMQQYQQGTWKIFTTGPDANRLVVYDTTGTIVLAKYDLKQSDGTTAWALPAGGNAQRLKV